MTGSSQPHPDTSGPLIGIRVVDLTAVIAGPYATMWLSDLGADVIKIEPPSGDTTRQAGHTVSPGMGSVFLTLGRGKRSVCVDLKKSEARTVVLDLCRTADVFVHNMRPEAITRLGLTHCDVRAVRPEVVYATLAGFDPTGPYRDRPAYDDMIQGLTGVATNISTVTGAPAYVPGVIADKNAGLVLSNAILGALFHRERTGRGQAVTVPLFETMAAYQLIEHLWDATFDPPVGAPGYVRVLSPDRRPFRTTDGWVCALPYQDKHFEALFTAIDRPDLASDPRFESIPARLKNVDHLNRTLQSILETDSTSQWLRLLDVIGVPAVPLSSLEDLLADPHLAATGFFEPVDHPTEGQLRLPKPPVTMTDSPPRPDYLAPRLGQHTIEEVRHLGYDEQRIADLLRSATIFDLSDPDGPPDGPAPREGEPD